MTRFLTLIAFVAAVTLPARMQAEQIVAGLSQNVVSITATFVGSEILIFGAIKREAPTPEDPLGVIVVVEGPSQSITVRRKAKRMGIWVNTDSAEVNAAPSFYAIATTAPFNDLVSETVDQTLHISIPESIRIFRSADVEDPENFAEAVKRIREREGLYKLDEGGVTLREDTLFDARIELPANLTEGVFKARIFLTRDGKVVNAHVADIDVQKVGLERWLYNLAQEQAFIYGLMSLAIAIAAGWGASAVFRVVLRS